MKNELYQLHNDNSCKYMIDHKKNMIYKTNNIFLRAFPIDKQIFDYLVKGLIMQGYEYIDDCITIDELCLRIKSNVKQMSLSRCINEFDFKKCNLKCFNYIEQLFTIECNQEGKDFCFEFFMKNHKYTYTYYDEIADICLSIQHKNEFNNIVSLFNRGCFRSCAINSLSFIELLNVNLKDNNKKIKLFKTEKYSLDFFEFYKNLIDLLLFMNYN